MSMMTGPTTMDVVNVSLMQHCSHFEFSEQYCIMLQTNRITIVQQLSNPMNVALKIKFILNNWQEFPFKIFRTMLFYRGMCLQVVSYLHNIYIYIYIYIYTKYFEQCFLQRHVSAGCLVFTQYIYIYIYLHIEVMFVWYVWIQCHVKVEKLW